MTMGKNSNHLLEDVSPIKTLVIFQPVMLVDPWRQHVLTLLSKARHSWDPKRQILNGVFQVLFQVMTKGENKKKMITHT